MSDSTNLNNLWEIKTFSPESVEKTIEKNEVIKDYKLFLKHIIRYKHMFHWTIETKEEQLKALIIQKVCGTQYVPEKTKKRKLWIVAKRMIGYQDIPSKEK